jgi:hypothetical protein
MGEPLITALSPTIPPGPGPEATGLVLSWDGLAVITTALRAAITADGVPEVVVGVVRGGLIPAVMLAHALGVRDVRAVEVIHTTADGANAGKFAKPQVRNPASLGELHGHDVVVVDDVAGSGESVALTVELVRAAGAARVRAAVCVVNEINWYRVDERDPQQVLTYLGRRCRGWMVFPWEMQ